MVKTNKEVKITEELKKELLTYWRDTKKDKEALARTADLFGLREEDVRHIIAVRWTEKKKFWDEDRVFRLKAYMTEGMGNTEIAKQLGCKTQAVADFKRRNKDMLPAYGSELGERDKTQKESKEENCRVQSYVGIKKEPSTAATDESSEKNTVEANSSSNNYSTDVKQCQESVSKFDDTDGNADDEVTVEMYNKRKNSQSENSALYTQFLEMWNKCNSVSGVLRDVELILKTAKYAGIYWNDTYGSYGNELAEACRMYDMLIDKVLTDVSEAVGILEGDAKNEKEKL